MVERLTVLGNRGGKISVDCSCVLKMPELGGPQVYENGPVPEPGLYTTTALTLPPWQINGFEGEIEKLGNGTTTIVVCAWQVLLDGTLFIVEEAVALTVKTEVLVRLLMALIELLEVKELGPDQVYETTELLVLKEMVLDCPGQISPEFVGVTIHTRPQLVVPAPGELALACWKVMF